LPCPSESKNGLVAAAANVLRTVRMQNLRNLQQSGDFSPIRFRRFRRFRRYFRNFPSSLGENGETSPLMFVQLAKNWEFCSIPIFNIFNEIHNPRGNQ
jgi:hypothetical protein